MQNVKRLISEEAIRDAVVRLGRLISNDYENRDLTILGILTGSIVLVTDLMRQVHVSHQLGLVQASSYRGDSKTAGELKINFDFLPEIEGRDVLLVDDIFDTGRTLIGIQHALAPLKPKSLRSAVLLWKKARTIVDLEPDYYCFEIPNEFVVGYGLDYQGEYRHLPYIGALSED